VWLREVGGPVALDSTSARLRRSPHAANTRDHEVTLLEPTAIGDGAGLGQLGFQSVRDLDAGNEA
jgi:hypothetical protein